MTDLPNGTCTYELDDGVATVTLNRPETLNSMNNELMADILSGVRKAEAEARVLVLTGSGRGFCSGADLSAVEEPDADAADPGAAVAEGMDDYFNPCAAALADCRIPTIARVNGVAAGGGLGLSMCCDVSIAARSAFFVATFGPRLGIVPDVGATWSLPTRVGRARALGITMLGDRFTADEAFDYGMVYKVVDDDELDAEVERAATILKNSSPEAMRRIRDAVTTAPTRTFAEQLDVERDHQKVLIPMNMVEGAAAFMEKRDPKFSD